MSRRTKQQRMQKTLSRMIDVIILGGRLAVHTRATIGCITDNEGTVLFQFYLPPNHCMSMAKFIEYGEASELVEKYWNKRNYVGRASIS